MVIWLIKQKQLPQKPSLDLEPKALSALPPAVFKSCQTSVRQISFDHCQILRHQLVGLASTKSILSRMVLSCQPVRLAKV